MEGMGLGEDFVDVALQRDLRGPWGEVPQVRGRPL